MTRPLLLAALVLTAAAAQKLTNPVTLAEDRLGRGDPLRVLVQDGPSAKVSAQVLLSRNGAQQTLDAAYEPGVVTAKLPDDAPLGTYVVHAVLDGKRLGAGLKLTLGPPGAAPVTLSKFDPSSTYDIDKDGTVRLTLRGKGFLPSSPQDNAVWINGVRQSVVWDRACSDPASAPEPKGIHGEVPSNEELLLCHVPVPPNGRLLVAAGFGDAESAPQEFRVFTQTRASVATFAFAIALVLALLPLFLLRFVHKADRIGGKSYRFRMLFLDPETDTYSLSKLQFYAWTVAALFGYAYLFISRVHVQLASWPDVPTTLPGIIVVSAGTAIGSQLVTSAKGPKGAGAENPSLADFITSGGVVAPDRLQMFLWTILGVGAFFYAVLQQLPGAITELPAIPDRLLVLMGISSAGYLGGKMARKPGPVINELSITPPDSDDALRDQSTPAPALPDLTGAVLRAQAALAGLPSGDAVVALKQAADAASSAHTVSDFNRLLADLGGFRDRAESAAARAAADFLAAKASAEDARIAQSAAAALQDLVASVLAAVSQAAAVPLALEENPPLVARTIELRGSNLSPDALLEIDDADLAFPMLLNSEGKQASDIVSRDDVNPTFARVLRLHIDPARLPAVYRDQVRQWFGKPGPHTFTLLNPDGQRAALSFTIPPAVAQKVGTTS